MIMFDSLIDRVMARVSPDRLWLHCVLATIAIFGLLVMMFFVNQQIAARSAGAATASELATLRRMQWMILVTAALALVAKGLFIFYPAYLAMRDHLRVVQDQTLYLQDAQKAREETDAKLAHITNHDMLTGLPNRGRLITLMAEHFDHGTAAGQTFLFIGLDGFKAINDTVGHDSGDELLIAVAKALHSCVDDDQIVARIGGDEFALITDEPPAAMLRRVGAVFEDPFLISGRRLKIRTSIGFLVVETDQTDPLAVLADAAMALQVAKTDGGNRAQQFTPALRESAGQFQRLQMEVSDAIRNGELEPWFQPQIRLTDGALHGVEVLARWRHPTRGLLTPDRFLAAVEKAGMTIEMDHAIWQAAMTRAMQWQTQGIWHPVLSLNAGPETIADPFLIERFLLGLRNSGLQPDQVIVEVLETTLIESAGDMAAINIDTLSECGIALELDDFGTGYASLHRLTQLPLSGIKLDRSLIAPLPDQGADSVVRAILALSAELGLHVIAEGIEVTGQAQHLLDRGCAVGQGYGFARPMPQDDFEVWLGLHAGTPIRIADEQLALVNEA